MDPAYLEPETAIFGNWVSEYINLKMTHFSIVCTANPIRNSINNGELHACVPAAETY